MVVLTIVAQKNGETIFFNEPIPQVRFMKLISCSLYNSWNTLKREGSAVLGDEKKDVSVSVGKIPTGHYNLESMAEGIKHIFERYNYDLVTKTNTPFGQLEIVNKGAGTATRPINLDRDLAELFGIGRRINIGAFVKYLRYPTAYFIHCDLIDRNFNFVNNKKSDLLAKIDVKGRPYEKVRYDASSQQPICDCSTSSHVNSITISVRDQDGELFDFKDMQLEFELELN